MDKMGIAAIYRKRNTSAPHPSACGVSVLAQKSDDRPTESGVGNRHNLYPDEARLCLLVAILDCDCARCWRIARRPA